MPKIIPTVGRKVYFYSDGDQQDPHDATVIKVLAHPSIANPESGVNLLVVNPDTGETRLEAGVCVADGPVPHRHYRWMDYQKESAARSAAIERQRADVGQVGQQQAAGSAVAGLAIAAALAIGLSLFSAQPAEAAPAAGPLLDRKVVTLPCQWVFVGTMPVLRCSA